MYELKVTSHFAAAHQLKMVAKKCENLHGHNWKVEVYVTGKELNNAGVLVDFGEIKRSVKEVMAELDHKFLNDLPMFDDKTPPSSENVARYIAVRLGESLAPVRVSRVTAWESEDACATYIVGE